MAEQIGTIKIFDPCAEDVPEELGLSRKLDSLQGKVVGILENRKYHADNFMQELKEVLVREYGAKKVVYATKFSYSTACAPETLDGLTAQCDTIIHGIAD